MNKTFSQLQERYKAELSTKEDMLISLQNENESLKELEISIKYPYLEDLICPPIVFEMIP